MTGWSKFAILLLSTLCLSQDFHGSLLGTISDASGARIPGATVTVDLIGSVDRRTVSSDHNGEFRLNDLHPGTYRVLAAATGLAQAEATVSVDVSSATAAFGDVAAGDAEASGECAGRGVVDYDGAD